MRLSVHLITCRFVPRLSLQDFTNVGVTFKPAQWIFQEVQHNCQLHRISFCADDKTDKRIFTFICKDSESNKHLCYVFDSEKCAEEITLTIGQAFDLAYRKFLESGGKDVETRKQIAGLQKRIQELETENTELKNKVQDLENQLRITQVHASP
ncbi:PREDICTED: PTB domain-containing engulfment adapter protein 1-like, partial [Apaloderma vittatum]|uniref:PTB domain-containing engulfment adapter protein 1-like n=1 Tax=Apaloderma vittatum TaxID=57397 RepID=UPI000521A689